MQFRPAAISIMVKSIIMSSTITIDYLPPIILRAISVTDDAVMRITCTGKELDTITVVKQGCTMNLLVGAVGHRKDLAIRVFGQQLFTIEHVYLCLVGSIVARHTPTCIKGNGRYGDIPTHSQPSTASRAAINKRQIGLHPASTGRDNNGIGEIGSAHVVGRRRLNKCQAI